jgi:hypothetical protein
MLFRATFIATATLAARVAVAGIGFAPPAHGDDHGSRSFVSAPPCDYVNVEGQLIECPDPNPGNFSCCDGTNSHATHRNGACSHHGGICGGTGSQGPGATLGTALAAAL